MLNPSEVESLLSVLCIELGFCLPPDEAAQLKTQPPQTPSEFVRAVFVAEKLDIELADKYLVRQVRDRVDQAFKRSEESALLAKHLQPRLGGNNGASYLSDASATAAIRAGVDQAGRDDAGDA